MSTFMQSAFKTLSALLLSAKTEVNIYLFTNHRNKESTPCLYPHHVTVFMRGNRTSSAKLWLGKWPHHSPRRLTTSFFLCPCTISRHLPSVASREFWYSSKQGNKSLLCVTNNMTQKSGTGKIPLESEFYLCTLFPHSFIGLCADWKKKLEKGEKALPSILLHVRMNLTACKEKSRRDREKSTLDRQGGHYPCEGSLFLSFLLIIHCSSLSAAYLYWLGLSFCSRK